ncbi:MAG: hypothetical protein AB8G96_05795 [Phycisphaerales bacterium]
MHAPKQCTRRLVVAAACAAFATGGTAYAGIAPSVGFDIMASDGTNESLMLAGSNVGPDLFNYAGILNDNEGDWGITYDFFASQDPTDALGAFLGTGFTVTNNTDGDLDFSLTLSLDIDPAALPETDYAGSVGYTLNGIDGSLTTDTSLYAVFIGDTLIDTLFDAPFELSFDGVGTESVSENLAGGMNGPAETISIVMEFTLSSGDSLTTTGAFGITAVPAPGALALLGAAGLVGRRRRRD